VGKTAEIPYHLFVVDDRKVVLGESLYRPIILLRGEESDPNFGDRTAIPWQTARLIARKTRSVTVRFILFGRASSSEFVSKAVVALSVVLPLRGRKAAENQQSEQHQAKMRTSWHRGSVSISSIGEPWSTPQLP
jgi:hypothetical protein